jgi:hypothetical protein
MNTSDSGLQKLFSLIENEFKAKEYQRALKLSIKVNKNKVSSCTKKQIKFKAHKISQQISTSQDIIKSLDMQAVCLEKLNKLSDAITVSGKIIEKFPKSPIVKSNINLIYSFLKGIFKTWKAFEIKKFVF